MMRPPAHDTTSPLPLSPPPPPPPPPKSLQLDAPLIDEALYSIFLPKLQNLFRYFSSSSSPSHNSKLVELINQEDVLLAIFRCCVLLYTSAGGEEGTPVTPAMSTLGLKMVPGGGDDDDDTIGSLFSNSTRRQQRHRQRHGVDSLDANKRKHNVLMRTLCFIACSTILPMIYKRLQRKLHDMQHSPSMSSDETTTMEQRARARQKKVLEYTVRCIQRVVPLLRVANYLAFLNSSSSSSNSAPATLAMRLSGLTFANSNNAFSQQPAAGSTTTAHKGVNRRQHVNFSFAYRRLLFEEMIRTMIQILPMALLFSGAASTAANSSVLSSLPSVAEMRGSMAQFIRQRINRIKHCIKLSSLNKNNIDDDNNDGIERSQSFPLTCVICSSNDITIPYIGKPCKHAFCYTCLRQAVTDNLSYNCPECGMVVQSSYRL